MFGVVRDLGRRCRFGWLPLSLLLGLSPGTTPAGLALPRIRRIGMAWHGMACIGIVIGIVICICCQGIRGGREPVQVRHMVCPGRANGDRVVRAVWDRRLVGLLVAWLLVACCGVVSTGTFYLSSIS